MPINENSSGFEALPMYGEIVVYEKCYLKSKHKDEDLKLGNKFNMIGIAPKQFGIIVAVNDEEIEVMSNGL